MYGKSQFVVENCCIVECSAIGFFTDQTDEDTRKSTHDDHASLAGAVGPNRMSNSSSGPLGVAIHSTALFRCTATSIQSVSVENGAVLSTQEVPRSYGTPVALTITGNTVVVVTSTLMVCCYTIAKRGNQLKETSCGRLCLDNDGAASIVSFSLLRSGCSLLCPLYVALEHGFFERVCYAMATDFRYLALYSNNTMCYRTTSV